MARNCKMNISPEIKKVVFELLTHCNLGCRYCLYHDKKHAKAPLPIDEICKLIDKFYADGIDRLVLTGGEPTLHPDFTDISKYAMLKIPRVSVCTNGVILSESLEEKIVNLNFSSYTVSVDSHIREIHDKIRGLNGSFEQVVNFLKKLRRESKNISIHITLDAENIYSISSTIDFARKFAKEIVVSTIYYEKNNLIRMHDRHCYGEKVKEIFSIYQDQPDIVLVGFGNSCSMEHCLDKKNVFMVNQYGKIVDCYWKNCNQI
ncbi:MAG: radical SAM protein [Patescibacteria group bacterium]|nr:radical SAM protein [Patescibacteria group bacterium]